MSHLVIQDVEKSYGSVKALTDVNISLADGQLVSFLGPSGCGKTTLLRLVAGLEKPSSGKILLDGEDITNVSTHQRSIGMVFQSPALFPHLNIWENIAYGLRIRGVGKAECEKKATELLDLVRLPKVGDRQITQLSGGQRQRVAIARALALEPRLFLLDEPMSALDANLREEMQVELKLLQQRLGITTIIVTHDQREAMTMSDVIVVMSTSRIQQVGSPVEIYRNPANAFVANFIGTSNQIDVVVEKENVVRRSDQLFNVPSLPDGWSVGDELILSIRPEDLQMASNVDAAPNRLSGKVSFIRDLGSSIETFFDCDGAKIISTSTPNLRMEVAVNQEVNLLLPESSCVVVKK